MTPGRMSAWARAKHNQFSMASLKHEVRSGVQRAVPEFELPCAPNADDERVLDACRFLVPGGVRLRVRLDGRLSRFGEGRPRDLRGLLA